MKVYEGIRHLTVVERWRRGRKLIPWHWDSESLEDLNGKRAEWALEDLIEKVLKPSLITALGLAESSDVMSVHVDRATFAHLSIDFEVSVVIPPIPAVATAKEAPRSSPEATLQRVRGAVRSDLSVSIAVLPVT